MIIVIFFNNGVHAIIYTQIFFLEAQPISLQKKPSKNNSRVRVSYFSSSKVTAARFLVVIPRLPGELIQNGTPMIRCTFSHFLRKLNICSIKTKTKQFYSEIIATYLLQAIMIFESLKIATKTKIATQTLGAAARCLKG